MRFKQCFALCLILLVSCAPTMKDLPKLQEKLGSSDEKTRISSVKKNWKDKRCKPRGSSNSLWCITIRLKCFSTS